MTYLFQRSYRGPLQAAIFDWAGTTVDYGCLAPAGAFVDLFKRHGVEATVAQARGPMGMHKRDHIATMIALPELAAQWEAKHGKAHTDEDVEALFQEFIPLQLEALPHYAHIIPGVPETVAALKARGMKIGGTTGYNQAMMDICMAAGKKAGYEPDTSVCVTEVPAGRPAPWMAVKAAMQLGVYPPEAIVKVGDTVTDVQEGLNAGMWSVAVVKTGNEIGLSEAEVAALPEAELLKRMNAAADKLAGAGAHYVIDGVSDLLPVIDAINVRLANGEKP
jgi:phosphonoacetaldehyde hydrolase